MAKKRDHAPSFETPHSPDYWLATSFAANWIFLNGDVLPIGGPAAAALALGRAALA
jgi:hypothetical protein